MLPGPRALSVAGLLVSALLRGGLLHATAGVWHLQPHDQLSQKVQMQALRKLTKSYSEGSIAAAEMLDYGLIFSWETE